MPIIPASFADLPDSQVTQLKQLRPHAPLLAVTLALLLLDALWCIAGRWTIPLHGLVLPLFGSLGVLAPLSLARYRHNPTIRTGLLCCASFIWFALAMAIFSYLTVATNAPLIDGHLARFDQRLGFDWPGFFTWVKQHAWFDRVLALAYGSMLAQISVAIVYLAFANRLEQLAEFNTVFVVTAVLTVIVSGFFPAEGPFKFYSAVHADVSMLSHFELLRTGTLRTIDPLTSQGLVSIPSFHTIVALLLAYAMRRTRVWPVFVLLNVVVIVSTPVCGGHYLVDLIAGALLLAVTIVLGKAGRNRIARSRFALTKITTKTDCNTTRG